MKKAKNEISKSHVNTKANFDREDKTKKVPSVQKQKKPLSIYDDFAEDLDDIDDLYDADNDEAESIWDYFDDDENEGEYDDEYDDEE